MKQIKLIERLSLYQLKALLENIVKSIHDGSVVGFMNEGVQSTR